MENSTSGIAGSIRVKALDSSMLAKMEKHGKREDETSKRRSVRDEEPIVFGGMDLADLQKEHVKDRKQQGQTKALHAVVQYPSKLMPNTEQGQKAMVRHAVKFVNEQYGGNAVFAARLDRDEKGTHKVDVFFLPRWQHSYKSGKTQDRCGIGTFAKERAKKRYVKQPATCPKTGKRITQIVPREKDDKRPPADDKRTQGVALQDCLYEYLSKGLPEIVRGQRKAPIGPDQVSPEVYGLKKDQERHAFRKLKEEQVIEDKKQQIILADRALQSERRAFEEERAQLAQQARLVAFDAAQNKKDALVISAARKATQHKPIIELERIKKRPQEGR
jgi:hypothetical protein